MKTLAIGLAAVVSGMSITGFGAPAGDKADEYYTEPQVYDLRPDTRKEMSLDCIGATGIKGRIYPGVVLKVEGLLPGAPAEGKVTVGQIIVGVNGKALQGINPFVALGEALTQAEATDGRMVFDVKDAEDAPAKQVTVMIPVLGAYSDTWPLDCEKSKKIVAHAAEYYANDPGFRQKYFNDKGEDGGMPSALACLFLLSTGDDASLPKVKAYFEGFPKDVNKIGDHTWNNGYNGIACAEYYLRTGDKDVLPILQYYCDNAKERQCFDSGWQHWGRSISPRYVAGGLMNPAGAQVLTTLLLAKECGVNVDEKTLLNALRFWYRFTGHGSVPYGDHRGEGGLGSNGKDGMSAAAMRVASYAQGDVSIYEQAMKNLSMATLTSYPSLIRGHADEGRGDGIWRGVASSYMIAYKPAVYHTAMNQLRWWYDLSRRPSGAIGMATCQRFDDEGSGAGVALAYTAPLKTLRTTGASRSKHAADFKLPARLWGRESDLAFLSIEPGRPYVDAGPDEPTHVPFYKFGNAYRKTADLAGVPRAEMLRNVHHRIYLIRTQATKALRAVGAFDELEKLLGDADPRIRRAALDGMTDYAYWFHIGKEPMKAEQFTPGMVAALRKMLGDPEEALYVVDGALMAMSLLPPATIGESLSLIQPWVQHDEWWLRQSAFCALAGAAADERFLPQVLPAMLETMVKENHTQPREGMAGSLRRLLKKHGAASPVGQQILAAHMKTAAEREIILGQRAGEGEYDVAKSVELLLEEAPESAPELARVISSRLGALTTASIVKTVGGVITVLDKMPAGERDSERDALDTLLNTVYRETLAKRLEAEGPNLALLDAIRDLTALRQKVGGWEALGTPPPAERMWRFVSFEPQPKDAMHPREGKRFRDVTLPTGMGKWFEPGFDDGAWPSGGAPIGKGRYTAKRSDVVVENRSAWGDGEFLLMRTTFEVPSLDYDYIRIAVLANQGFRIYLNGNVIHTYIWWANAPEYRTILLGPEQTRYLKKGTNHLAVYANAAYVDETPVGQFDVRLEGLRKSDVLGAAGAKE